MNAAEGMQNTELLKKVINGQGLTFDDWCSMVYELADRFQYYIEAEAIKGTDTGDDTKWLPFC